jgi:hypothetical protein
LPLAPHPSFAYTLWLVTRHVEGSPARCATPPGVTRAARDVLAGARFLTAVPGMLWRPIYPPRARRVVRERVERRATDFVALVRRLIVANPTSPYARLLGAAGCEAGDVERLVTREGLEPALAALFRAGVYLTVDELKGRRPVVRGGLTFPIEPGDLVNPLSRVHLVRHTSGSGGPPSAVAVDLRHVRDCALDTCLAFEARGGAGWRHAVWTVPGASAIVQMLHLACFGAWPERCFLQVDPRRRDLHPRYAWSMRLLRATSMLAGAPLPRPELAALDDPMPIARWMAATLRSGAIPHLVSFVSPAILLCRAARASGLDLRGAVLTVGGEPLTPARRATLEAAGLGVMSGYASTETGGIATDCLAPDGTDDLHVQLDRVALIQPGPAAGDTVLRADALLATTLRASAPLLLVNASLGDSGRLARRTCGCPLQALGWDVHLREVRSFEKLTAGGMTFHDTAIARVLDETLPARFGGGPTDYQLVESESPEGEPRLTLRVHPAVGAVNELDVVDAFLDGIGGGSGAERVMSLQWRQAGFVQVERQAPTTTASGKILHLQTTGR